MTSDLKLSEIWIYPVKSLRGISLSSATVLPKGLKSDRRFMLIDHQGTAITQRTRPTLALFRPEIKNKTLAIHYGDDTLEISLEPSGTREQIAARVWDDTVEVCEVSPESSLWFTEKLGIECKLVFFPEENPRSVDSAYQQNGEHVSLADAYPILIIGQKSLGDLNSKLAAPLPMNRFRPNLVFTGGTAFTEDTWKNFRVGETRFSAVKPCARCILTTIDQETAQRGQEPLKTLATYRTKSNKVLFGQNVLILSGTEIKVGDPILIESYK